MERCHGQAVMVRVDHVNSWWGVELLIPLLKHTNKFYFVLKFVFDRCHHVGSKRIRNHIIGVEYASYVMVPSANRNKISWTISSYTNKTIRVQSGKGIQSRE